MGYPEKLGLKFSKADIFPNINITNMYGLGSGLHANYQENQHDISDAVTLIRGRHTLHIGGNLIRMIADSTAWGNINGATLGFTGVYTAGSNTGIARIDNRRRLCRLPVGLCQVLVGLGLAAICAAGSGVRRHSSRMTSK